MKRAISNGPNEEFSFCDAYAPADFGTVRGCDARVWAFFRTVADDMDQYTDYAMGYNMSNRMPLWVKPRTKVDPKTVFDAMRDHYEGTPMDMTQDIGAGGHALPYRWRPMDFEVDGVTYLNEACGSNPADRILVRGTGPALAAGRHGHPLVRGGRRSDILPDADLLLGNRGSRDVSREGNGTMLKYSPTSAFWLFNRVTNFAYLRYDLIAADIRKVVDEWENTRLEEGSNRSTQPQRATRPRNGRNGLPVIRWIWPGNSSTAGRNSTVPARQIHRRQPEERNRTG